MSKLEQAFRQWFEKVKEHSEELIRDVLPEDKRGAAMELAPYLVASLGNETRIDYGTGHETTFVVLLTCLERLECFSSEAGDYVNIPLTVFNRYLLLMRKIQTVYMLEPAGQASPLSLQPFCPCFTLPSDRMECGVWMITSFCVSYGAPGRCTDGSFSITKPPP